MTRKNIKDVSYSISGDIIDEETQSLIHEMEKKFPEMTKEFKRLSIEQYITFIKKQHDYGPSNIAMNTQLETKEDLMMSLAGLVTRMNDKMSRLIHLILRIKKSPSNESTEDSFKDISVYGIIARIVIASKWGK